MLETHLLALVGEVNFSFSSLGLTDPRIIYNMKALNIEISRTEATQRDVGYEMRDLAPKQV